MVAREFKYVMEHYSGDSEDYAEITQSFNYYLNKVEQLWKDGLDILAVLLKDYRTNVLVLSYLLENNRYVKKSIGFGINDILNPTGDTSELDKAYNRVAQYFIESGWKDRARRILGEALKLNPGNKAAAEHLVKLNSNDIENN
jgi:hypothetical protein